MVAPGVGRAVWAEPGTAASPNARRRARPTATPLPIPGHWTSEDYGVQLPEDAAEEDQLELHVQAGRPTGGRAPGSSGAIPPPEKPRRPAKGETKRDRKRKAGKGHLRQRSFTKLLHLGQRLAFTRQPCTSSGTWSNRRWLSRTMPPFCTRATWPDSWPGLTLNPQGTGKHKANSSPPRVPMRGVPMMADGCRRRRL